jgi:cation diffusion facilitator family transporter
MKDSRAPSSGVLKKSRFFYGKLGAWASISLNFILFALKGILGLMTGSLALIADAFHTLSDLATSFIVLVSFHVTAKPSDPEHPFGHGRAEFISAIIMSTLLAITAFELMKQSIDRMLNPTFFKSTWTVIAIIFITVIFKEALAIYVMNLSKKINSDTLRADAWHHHLDAFSSLLVIVAFIFSYFNIYKLDGPVGVLITLTIFYSAFIIAKRPVDNLLGTPPSEELLDKIEGTTLTFPEVRGVHDVIIHNYGEMTVLSLHIEVDDDLSFTEAHRIAEQVDKKLRKEVNAHVTVHFDPVMKRTPVYRKIEKQIQEFCQKTSDCDSFHDLRIYGKSDKLRVVLDLVAAQNTREVSANTLIKRCENDIKENIPEVEKVIVKVEPKFSISRKSRHN